MRLSRFLLLGALALLSTPVFAEKYAVLIGVGHYQNGIHALDGPAFDVAAIHDLLLQSGYNAASITVLVDQQATRAGIIGALKNTVDRLKSGDRLLFYYSGHGTSAFDKGLQWLSPEIGPDSGGLATYDLSLESLKAAADSLVIGRRDLRPILSRVPSGAQALVVLDACYSENSAKSVSVISAPIRGINLVDIVQQGPSDAPGGTRVSPPSGGAEGGVYPYSNVVSLSAASKDQPALDISLDTMRQKPDWRTVDGKPHGALTNALLEAMLGRGDTNHDGLISYDEMFRYVRREMEKYPHQPQLLFASGFSLDQSALGTNAKPPEPPPPAPSAAPARIRVHLESSEPALEAKLKAIPDVQLVPAEYDLLVRRNGNLWGIHDASGVLIQSLPIEQLDAVVARVRIQGQLTQLRLWASPTQAFNVKIDAEPVDATGYDKLRGVFHVKENVRFRISSERPAYLLLLGIDKNGRVTVLFPGPPANERALQPAGKAVEFVVRVTPPAGSEQLKLIGFSRQPEHWEDWICSATACPEFDAGDARMSRLMQFLRSSSGTAETSLRVITQE